MKSHTPTRRTWSLVLSVCLWPTVATAYSDPARFDQPAEEAGGAGRWFTGSPEDGYACSVCHRGAAPPKLQVTGLPERFQPGKLYQVELTWDGAKASHALHLELVDAQGRHPDVSIEPERVLGAAGRCDGDPQGEAANYAIDREQRRIVGVRDCGASRVALQFRAPDAPELYFAASIVHSDGSADPRGDGVTDLRRVLRNEGRSTGQGCSLGTSLGERRELAWALAVCVIGLSATRSRARRWPRARRPG